MATPLLDPLPASEWNRTTARHLLNRAGFGIPRERVAQLASVGRDNAVRMMVDGDSAAVSKPSFLPDLAYYRAYMKERREAPLEERPKIRQKFVQEERARIDALRMWWLDRIFTGAQPLEEKMTLFWHGHFATSTRKVKNSIAAYELNATFRSHALGNFKDLTTQVGQSRSMLQYLDNNRNVKGKPNENWARELMELFTLGVGNYSEDDIKESARAFTGWTSGVQGFNFDKKKHDAGEKVFFDQRGNFDGYDAIRIIFEQSAAARFMVTKLWTFFAYDAPETDLVDELAASFRESGYDLRPLMRKMFRSRAFYSARAMGTQIKSPVQLAVQLSHDLQLEPVPYAAMARSTADLGQNLFEPPNVKGWEGGRKWINANALVTRYNLPKSLLMASVLTEEDEGESMNAMAEMPMAMKTKETVRGVMALLPRAERRELQQRLKDASAYERGDVLDQYLLKHSLDGLWDPRPLLNGIEFSTAGECVDGIAAYYLGTPLAKDTRSALIQALAKSSNPDAPLTAEDIEKKPLEEAFHLLLSAAEYQLC